MSKITQEIYNFILKDDLFSSIVNLDIRLLKSCMDADIRKVLPPTIKCPDMILLSQCAKLIMKLKKMQMGPEGNPEYELNTLRELLKFEYINKPVLKEWCIEHLARRFRHYDDYYNAEIFEAYARAPLHSAEQGNAKILEATIPEHFYNDFIGIMNELVPKRETEVERLARTEAERLDEDRQTRAFDERMKAEARERGRALYEEDRRQGAAIVQAEKDREELNRSLFEDWGIGGKGKRKRTQRRRKQQRKLKHKRYSSRYKRKSKSRR
jgi:hypothetical protein